MSTYFVKISIYMIYYLIMLKRCKIQAILQRFDCINSFHPIRRLNLHPVEFLFRAGVLDLLIINRNIKFWSKINHFEFILFDLHR